MVYENTESECALQIQIVKLSLAEAVSLRSSSHVPDKRKKDEELVWERNNEIQHTVNNNSISRLT